jgi:hypothetical protein
MGATTDASKPVSAGGGGSTRGGGGGDDVAVVDELFVSKASDADMWSFSSWT